MSVSRDVVTEIKYMRSPRRPLREEKPGSPTAQQTADERQQQQQQPSEDNMNP